MSVHTSTPPHPSESPRNPKAEAKAAKAYAKAMRPWYKKKRVIIPVGFVALAIAGTAASGGNTGSSTASSGTASSAKSAPSNGQTDGAAAKVGQAVTNAGMTYKVTSVETASEIGDPDLLGSRTDGKFVIVSLELTNNKDETKTFSDSSAKLKSSNGKEYETSDKAVMAFGDDNLLLKDVQPELTTHGKLAFELPSSKLNGSTLVIEDLWGAGEVKVDLGL
jgi:hypothetical protein